MGDELLYAKEPFMKQYLKLYSCSNKQLPAEFTPL